MDLLKAGPARNRFKLGGNEGVNIDVLLKVVVMNAAVAIADGCRCGPQRRAPERRGRRSCALWQLRDAIAIA